MSSARKEGARWIISGGEDSVVWLFFDFAVTLQCADGLAVRVGEPLVLRSSNGVACELDPEDGGETLGPLLGLVRDRLTGGTAEADGSLELVFASGRSVAVAPSADYEAWELSGPDGLKLISLPGGGLAEWSPYSEKGKP